MPTILRALPARHVAAAALAGALLLAPAGAALADPSASPSPTATSSPGATPGTTAEAGASPSDTPPAPTESPAPPSPSGSPTESAPPASPEARRAAAPEARSAAAGGATLLGAAGAAAPTAAFAADFVARTLAAGGDHYVYPDSGGYVDGGNTIDGILALDGAGAGSAQADASFDFLAGEVAGYIGATYDSTYAGPTAKALLAVLVHGGDPTAFGGVDLVATLRATEGAVEPGRFSDLPVDCGYSPCDYSNTIGQSLAVIALLRAGEVVSDASVDVLLAQQCADGGFRGEIGAEGCTSDPDATAFAAQALIAAGADAEAADALDWLAGTQLADGALRSSDGTPNANTTGVAAQAFAAAGHADALAAAQAFLVSLQYDCTSPAALRGGIAFSAATRSTSTASDSDLRATPQAALGLSGESLLSVTGEGADSGTTATPCSTTPTTTPTATSSTTPPATTPTSGAGSTTDDTTTGSAGAAGSGGAAGSAGGGSSPTGSLAQTGSDLLLPVGLGLLLVVLGAAAVLASRERGAHA